ncbi:MAG: RNA pyrophosphohydrolase [Rhodospirillaceae bacterium]|jgi:putative (di)nucleoside polyphosphate hydrolase
MTTSAKPYRQGVGVVLMNNDGKVFVAQRIDTSEPAWQLPQGGIDKGENPYAAAIRELEEETGITNATLVAETNDWLRYDLPADLQSKVWKGRYKGQEQKWYLMRFTGTDDEINLATEHPEFSAWKWADFRTIPELIVEFKQDLYWQIIDAFSDHVRPAFS